MRYHEFIDRVRERADFASRDEAVRATKATLATLGERLYRTERDHLTAQLPEGLKQYIYAHVDAGATRQDAEHFSLEEFYNRVGARSDVTYTPAVEWAQVVMSILEEAVSAGQLRKILSTLPDEYAELFGKEPESPASPSAVQG